MSVVAAFVVRRIIEVSRGPEPKAALLERVGLPVEPPPSNGDLEIVPAEAYYSTLERCGADDPSLPLRYGAALRPEDLGAFGLALKTSHSVRDVLERLARYILVVSDTLEYTLHDDSAEPVFVLDARPSDTRRAIQLANECALAAIVSFLRQATGERLVPEGISFRHPMSDDPDAHAAYFGCGVRFGAPIDGIHLSPALLDRPTLLGDDGLSSYLLSVVEDLHAKRSEGALVGRVRRAIADRLCSGMPSRAVIARQLGMSERTLHRRLAERDSSFKAVSTQVRREVAESLLARRSITLAEVAYLTGFSDQSAFQRAFKSWTGQTPNGFRQAAI